MPSFESFPMSAEEKKEEIPTQQPPKRDTPEWSTFVDRINREETEKHLPEWLEKARKGLDRLYESIPHDQKISTDDLMRKMEPIFEFKEMLPGMRRKFVEDALHENLHKKPKEEFITKGMTILQSWVHGEAMTAGTHAVLERLQEVK